MGRTKSEPVRRQSTGPVFVLTEEMRNRAYDVSLVQVLIREAQDALREYNDLSAMDDVPPTLAAAAIEGMIEVFQTMSENGSDMQSAIQNNRRLRAFRQ